MGLVTGQTQTTPVSLDTAAKMETFLKLHTTVPMKWGFLVMETWYKSLGNVAQYVWEKNRCVPPALALRFTRKATGSTRPTHVMQAIAMPMGLSP